MPENSASPQPHKRFGRPQLYALLLLAAFAGQCVWAIRAAPVDQEERRYAARSADGLDSSTPPQRERGARATTADVHHSPLVYSAAARGSEWMPLQTLRYGFLFLGLLRGASLWYVARRVCGNRGGYLALALYCFSPRMVQEASHAWPDVLAGWGFFGAVFLAIASAHTLYAAPGALPWRKRWKRPILLGIALGIGVSAQYSVALAAPLALGFMLYLAPGRRWEAMRMWLVECAIALFLLFAAFGFSARVFVDSMAQAQFVALPWSGAAIAQRHDALREAVHSTNLVFFVLLVVALLIWALWRRARYFGNSASLVTMLAIALFTPLSAAPELWRLWTPAQPFAFMFIAGVTDDLFAKGYSLLRNSGANNQ